MSVYENTPEPSVPRRPWDFLGESLRGFHSRSTLQFLVAWVVLQGLSSFLWARHLQTGLGSSTMGTYWGDGLAGRDVVELAVNGGLQHHPFGAPTTVVFWAAFLWVLWSGWRLQAAEVGLKPRFGAWGWGLLDAVLIGVLPIGGLAWLVRGLFSVLASTGIQWLGWLDWLGGGLVTLSAGSAFMVQWWLCRLGRAGSGNSGWLLGGVDDLARHLGHSFARLWLHFLQWTGLIALGVLLRVGCFALVLALSWRWGGGTTLRVGAQFGALVLAMVVAASALAMLIRLVAHFWRNDHQVRLEIQALTLRARGK